MRLTFRGWLLAYCQELTGLKTTSVKKLVSAVEGSAPHASAAVFLFALEVGRLDDLTTRASDPELLEEWGRMASMVSKEASGTEAFARSNYGNLPVSYQKVLDAFDAIAEGRENDERVKALMAEKTASALARAGKTRYRLCRDLGLNEGNVYAWLAGDSSKVSRETARRAWRYAEAGFRDRQD